MPDRPKHPCAHPGCTELVSGAARCGTHTVAKRQSIDKWRGSSHERGYDRAWQRVRLAALKRDLYLCQHCMRDGRPTPATCVDHIMPIAAGGARLDLENCQSLCTSCHSIKTATEDGGFGNSKADRSAHTPPA